MDNNGITRRLPNDLYDQSSADYSNISSVSTIISQNIPSPSIAKGYCERLFLLKSAPTYLCAVSAKQGNRVALVKEAGLANEEAPFVIIVIYHYIIICVLTHDTRLQVYCLQLWPSVGTLVAHYRLLEAAADQGNL